MVGLMKVELGRVGVSKMARKSKHPKRRRDKPYAAAVYAVQEGNCFYCGEFITMRNRGKWKRYRLATKDHVFPQSRPGLRNGDNAHLRGIVMACKRCNGRKGDRAPTENEVRRLEELEAMVRMKFPHACDAWF